jgi:hypothetical protein
VPPLVPEPNDKDAAFMLLELDAAFILLELDAV